MKFGGHYNRSLQERDSVTSTFIRHQPDDNPSMWVLGAAFSGRDDTQSGRFSRHDPVAFPVNDKF